MSAPYIHDWVLYADCDHCADSIPLRHYKEHLKWCQDRPINKLKRMMGVKL